MFRLQERISRFMYGRYGFDVLGRAMLILYVVVAVINVLVPSYTVKNIIFMIQWMLLLLAVFRMLSRNFPARRRENQVFQQMVSKFSQALQLTVRRFKDIKFKRYRKCPLCKSVMRLPIKKGRHTVKCVNCHQPFKVFIVFYKE